METEVELVFVTASGSNHTLNVPSPVAGLTAAAAKAVMNTIISKNIFTTKGGDLVGIHAARLHTTNTVDLA